MTRLGFSFNADECMGCKVCVVACKDVHDLPVGYKLRKVVTGEAGTWEQGADGICRQRGVFSYSVSYSCMHCEHPACLPRCPKQAVRKDEGTGVVWIDRESCVGCGACARACPWDAPAVVPRMDGARRARKCDLCRDLLARGEEPACVAACLMRCLKVVDVDAGAPPDAARGDASGGFRDALLADAPELGPSFLFTPHRRAAEAGPGEVRVHSMPEEYLNG